MTKKIKDPHSEKRIKVSKKESTNHPPNPTTEEEAVSKHPSTVHPIPKISLSSSRPSLTTAVDIAHETPTTKELHVEAEPTGDIFLLQDIKGECLEGIRSDGNCKSEGPRDQNIEFHYSDFELETGGGVEKRAVTPGDKLLITGGYRDKFTYLFGSKTSKSEVKRQEFTSYLHSSGILELISKFILGLKRMPVRPPPEQALELMVKSMGSKIGARGILKEMKEYKSETEKKIEQLSKESEELRSRLEKYTALYTPYEFLDPDDFAHLAPPKSKALLRAFAFFENPEMVSSPAGSHSEKEPSGESEYEHETVPTTDKDEEEDEEHIQHLYESPEARDPSPDSVDNAEFTNYEEKAESKSTHKLKKLSQDDPNLLNLMKRTKNVVVKQKYAAMARPKLEDLDVEGLFKHFATLSTKESKMNEKDKKKEKESKKGSPNPILPQIEIVRKAGPMESDLRMPPIVVNQLRKYLPDTKIPVAADTPCENGEKYVVPDNVCCDS